MAAVTTAERLTSVAFLVERDNPATPVAMMSDGALIVSAQEPAQDPGARLKTVAGLYAKWLDNDGRDPATWLRALIAYRECRWGIERWAGRTFASDQEIVAWWPKAKEQEQREWLEENLARTSAEADTCNAKAQYIIRCVLPDLPHAEHDEPFAPPWRGSTKMSYQEKPPGP